jgi:hypothetical protein
MQKRFNDFNNHNLSNKIDNSSKKHLSTFVDISPIDM